MKSNQSEVSADLVERGCAAFKSRYGLDPKWIATAPGRVNIIGEYTDFNEGFVLPMAIDRKTVAVAAANGSMEMRVYSSTTDACDQFSVSSKVERGADSHTGYVRGVVRGFQDLGANIPGLDVLVLSDVPMGGGLSSSAALEVAMATLLEGATGCALDPKKKVLLCQKAEHDFAGVPCGVMDQMASTFSKKGHLLLLDCRSLQPQFVPFASDDIAVLIINTNVRHELSESEYALRRASCGRVCELLKIPFLRDATMDMLQKNRSLFDEQTWRRAKHVVLENARTLSAAEAIQSGVWDAAGGLMYESHTSLRNDFEVSCHELDIVVEVARKMGETSGVYGCRMTGGGFGGCAVALIKSAAHAEIVAHIQAEYLHCTGCEASCYVSKPSEGASLISRLDDRDCE